MAAEITLRSYRELDFETLLRIDHDCFPRGIAYGPVELRIYLSSPRSFCLVAEVGGEIAGFIVIECAGAGGAAHIITIDVPEAHRQHGVGTALLGAAENRAAGEGARRMDLESATTNNAAIAFWRKHGYRESGIFKNYYGRGLDAFEMQKAIRTKIQS